jgi:predicted nucleic acid-binding protein
MVLVDTSVWVLHLRGGKSGLEWLLDGARVACHPFIIGEIACGNLKNRAEILSLLQTLPVTKLAEHEEVMRFIEDHGLMGRGLGYIDVHLLASALLSGVPIWTLDKQLDAISAELGVRFHKKQ